MRDAEIVNLAHSVRLQIDAYAERAHLAHRFEYDAWHVDLVERKRRRQPANAAAGDNYQIIRHTLDPIYILMNFIILLDDAGSKPPSTVERERRECRLWVLVV